MRLGSNTWLLLWPDMLTSAAYIRIDKHTVSSPYMLALVFLVLERPKNALPSKLLI